MFEGSASSCPIGSVVIHKKKPEFGYGIVVSNFEDMLPPGTHIDELIAMVLWHGDEEKELTETPQLHPFSDLKILNTTVGFA
jgi:hypothetical protein